MKHTTFFFAAVAALTFASDGTCAEAAPGGQPSAPKTYCNPMPLPGIPVNSGCRNGKPSRTPGSSYREIADPSFLYDNGTLYLYPSMGMAWKSKDCGATWEQMYDAETNIRYGCWYLGYLSRRFDGDPKKDPMVLKEKEAAKLKEDFETDLAKLLSNIIKKKNLDNNLHP